MGGRKIRIPEEELRYLAFSEVYNRHSQPKTKRKVFALLEAAISSLAKAGFEGVSLAMIAREAGVTRQLMHHYFKDQDEILDFAIKYIRVLFQKMAIEALLRGKEPQEMLSNYIEACFDWVIDMRQHSLVWLRFLHRCGLNNKARALNTDAVIAGNERLQALLTMGREAGVFQFEDAEVQASLIQVTITGSLVCLVSQNIPDTARYRKEVRLSCLALVGIVQA